MSQQFRLFLFGGCFVLALIFLWRKNQQPQIVRIVPIPTSLTNELTPTQMPIKIEEPKSLTEVANTNGDLERTIASFPKDLTGQYQKSLHEDPHQVPTTTLRTALELGKIYDMVQSEKEARTAFGFFNKCVTDEKVRAIQTSCFRYARRLRQKYSALQFDFEKLEGQTSPDVLRIVQLDEP